VTDISNWPETIHIMKVRAKNPWTGNADDYLIERIMVPLNEYQMGNLIDAISQVQNTGDWHGEFCDIVACAMKFAGIKQLTSNRGNTFTLDDVANRLQKRATSENTSGT
jgi:hypothetical protein